MPRKPKTPKSKQDRRCQHTTADGRRCRLPRMNNDTSLCLDHWRRRQQILDADAVAAEILGSLDGFRTATEVNHALGKLFALLARNRIPTRNAAILAYIGQLLLQSQSALKWEIKGSQGSDSWDRVVSHALRNASRKSAASQLTQTARQQALPPDEDVGETEEAHAAG